MLKYLCLIVLSLSSLAVSADEWVSPIDKKYKERDRASFARFNAARSILNSWRGEKVMLKRADALLQGVLGKDPEFAPAYREYGRLAIMAGFINSEESADPPMVVAEKMIWRSIEIEPDYADAYVLLGHLYANMNRYGDAENALRKAEAIGTEIPWLDLNWAELLDKTGRYEEALSRYRGVVERGTSNRKAYAAALDGVATTLIRLNRNDEAKEGYQALIEYEPDSAWNWGDYASFLLYRYGDADGAIENASKALSLMDYGMGRFTLACALYTKWARLQGDPATSHEAQPYFDRAWALYPYPEKVVETTMVNRHTRATAQALQQWLKNRENRGPKNGETTSFAS